MILGDSHISRMQNVASIHPHNIEFIAKSGLDILEYPKCLTSLYQYNTVIVTAGGNYASDHPVRGKSPKIDPLEVARVIANLIKRLCDKNIRVFVLEIRATPGYEEPYRKLNYTLKKKFRKFFIDLQTIELKNRSPEDKVHKSDETYRRILNEINKHLSQRCSNRRTKPFL